MALKIEEFDVNYKKATSHLTISMRVQRCNKQNSKE